MPGEIKEINNIGNQPIGNVGEDVNDSLIDDKTKENQKT